MLTEILVATEEVTESNNTEITAKEDAQKAETSVVIEYSYSFSDGLKKLINQAPKTASNGWTGGQFNVIPP